MKICHYDNNQAGIIVENKVYNVGDALIKAGLARHGYTMLEIIDALANNSKAMQIARDASEDAAAIPLNSVKLLAPITNPGSLWAAAANYRPSHQNQRRADGGVLPQDDIVHHRSGRHDNFAENFQAR
jgi:hypothetical protein